MAYRKTKRSKEVLARMKAGKDRARMERPAPDYPPELPHLRRCILIVDYLHPMRTLNQVKSTV